MKLASRSWASVLLLGPGYMMRPSPEAPMSARNSDHFPAAASWLPPRAWAAPILA